jgi:alpha(1,3/1,4) fucosyltransferase
MKRVLIRPPWNPWLQNRMFCDAQGCVYVQAFALWRRLAADHGFQLDTWDMHPLREADCIMMMDLPPTRVIYEQARRDARAGIPFVLQTLESPLLGPQNFVEANQRRFDVVVAFANGHAEAPSRFSYFLPNTLRAVVRDVPFARRRCAVMLNSNRVEGFFAVRQPGMTGLPGIGRCFTGWRVPLGTLIRPANRELYSWRRALARAADVLGDEFLDLFGAGWQGEQISWFPGYQNRPYRCAAHRQYRYTQGSENRGSKQDLFENYRFGIATENYRGNLGYISEKLFDVLMAGAVPVYLGDERVTDYVPAACFVDARNFRSHRELLTYLRDCREVEWQAMRNAGQVFLASEKMRPFTDEAFAERMVEILKRVLGD